MLYPFEKRRENVLCRQLYSSLKILIRVVCVLEGYCG